MVGVAQLVERQTVALNVAGSNPVFHPASRCLCGVGVPRQVSVASVAEQSYAPVAQLDRASDFESGGRRFESCRARSQVFRFCVLPAASALCISMFFVCMAP